MAKIEERIEALVQGPIEDLGYQLYDVTYDKEGKDYFLRIYIENDTGISLDDCEKVNNEIEGLIDSADLIKEQYFLEVSSTGVEKVLRKNSHLEKEIGNLICVSLFKAIDGKKEIVGTLKSFNDTEIEIDDEKILRKDIAMMKKYYDWGN